MDVSEYKKEFIIEAREHVSLLNQKVLVLEKNPADQDNINELFRSFHTLKGNSAAMGFMKFSELAHHLEDLLSNIRDKKIQSGTEIINILLDGVDILEQGLELIDEDKSEDLNDQGLTEKIKKLLNIEINIVETKTETKLNLTEEQKTTLNSEKNKGLNIHRTIIIFDPQNTLKAPKALIILRDIESEGKIINLNPKKENIKKGEFSEIDILFSSPKNQEETSKSIDSMSGIKNFVVLKEDEEYVPSNLANKKNVLEISNQTINDVDKKEKDKKEIITKNKANIQTESVKVDMKNLDVLMNLVGELLISNIRLKDIETKKNYAELKTVLTGVERLIVDLKDEVMEIRMLPIGHIFERYPRMVRDLALKEEKKIELEIEGQEIKFDRTVLDEIGDPLIHLLRNSVDHGIESSQERIKKGKSETGLIKLIATRDKNNAVIEIMDDGAGIDPKKIKESSIKKGFLKIEEAQKMSDQELQMLIFKPGMSTNETITEVSGRGVGMDVVLSKITSLGGTVLLQSEVGKGTTIRLELPLTVAIIMAFLVKTKEETYAIPLANIEENLDIKIKDIKSIRQNKVFILRNKEIPLFFLDELTGIKKVQQFEEIKSDKKEQESNETKNKQETNPTQKQNIKEILTVIVISIKGEKIGLVVDEILSQQQILIKALQPCIKNTKGVAGVTILGDGNVALILDVNTLL